MSVPPTPRHEEVYDLANAVFDLLAGGRDGIELTEFTRFSAFLAEISEDFSADPEAAFRRIDLDGDGRVDRSEFAADVKSLADTIGPRDVLNGLVSAKQQLEESLKDGVARLPSGTYDASLEGATQEVLKIVEKKEELESMLSMYESLSKKYGVDLQKVTEAVESLKADPGPAPPPPAQIHGVALEPTEEIEQEAEVDGEEEEAEKEDEVKEQKVESQAPTPEPDLLTKPVTKKRLPETDGTQFVETYELGLAFKTAASIGNEVWAVDVKGQLTVRDRENPSCVIGEVPTVRPVSCVLTMQPELVWVGQEDQGIALFDGRTKAYLGSLIYGHRQGSGVTCLLLDDVLVDCEEGESVPRRRVWSGGSEGTIRQWGVETWSADKEPPAGCEDVHERDCTVSTMQDVWKTGVYRERQMRGHRSAVRTMLRIGPVLWSGGDEGAILVWRAADQECIEVVKDAHKGGVVKLAVVRPSVWSCGNDGKIREWNIGGDKRECLRELSIDQLTGGINSMVPAGRDVLVCGKDPSVQVLSQKKFKTDDTIEAHDKLVTSLLPVDRLETRIVWSTSIADKKLKVWRHTIRGDVPSLDDLKAANKLYEELEDGATEQMSRLSRKVSGLEEDIKLSEEEFRTKLAELAQKIAEAKAGSKETVDALDAMRQQAQALEDELAGLRAIFEAAGLGHLLDDPEALKKFLEQSAALMKVLEDLGLLHLLDDPQALRKMLDTLAQWKKILEDHGLGDAIDKPSKLSDVLTAYNDMKKVFEKHGYLHLFQDPEKLEKFLKTYADIKAAFEAENLEHLLDSYMAMKDFLAKHGAGEKELKELREKAARLAEAEAELARLKAELAKLQSTAESLRAELAPFEELGDLDACRKFKEDSEILASIKKSMGKQAEELERLRKELEAKEAERQAALDKANAMAHTYRQLDIFKLDVIARELREVDGENELGLLGKNIKSFKEDTGKLKNYDEQQQMRNHGEKMLTQCHDLRTLIRATIDLCVSETAPFREAMDLATGLGKAA